MCAREAIAVPGIEHGSAPTRSPCPFPLASCRPPVPSPPPPLSLSGPVLLTRQNEPEVHARSRVPVTLFCCRAAFCRVDRSQLAYPRVDMFMGIWVIPSLGLLRIKLLRTMFLLFKSSLEDEKHPCEGEKSIGCLPICALTGGQTRNLGM